MPSYEGQIGEEEVFQLIQYIKSMAKDTPDEYLRRNEDAPGQTQGPRICIRSSSRPTRRPARRSTLHPPPGPRRLRPPRPTSRCPRRRLARLLPVRSPHLGMLVLLTVASFTSACPCRPADPFLNLSTHASPSHRSPALRRTSRSLPEQGNVDPLVAAGDRPQAHRAACTWSRSSFSSSSRRRPPA